jgi:hypothetical protein
MQKPRSAPYALTFTCHGVPLGIRADDPGALALAAERVPPGSRQEAARPRRWYAVGAASDGGPHRLRAGAATVARAAALDDVLDALESLLAFHVATRAEHHLFVHAGVVGVDGRALLLPGRTRSGKTTLVRALVRAGAVYFSDEFAVVDAEGRVHPYARPLSVRVAGADRPLRIAPAELGGRVSAEPWPVGLVAALRYEAGPRREPRPLSPGESVLALLDNTVLARERPDFALRVLGRAVRGARGVGGPRGGAEAAAGALLDAMTRM